MSKLQTDREKLAQILGQDVKLVEPRWLSLMRQGVVVELHIRRWRAKSRLTLDDLGLPNTDATDYSEGEVMVLAAMQLPIRTMAGWLWKWPPVRPTSRSGVDEEMGTCGKCRVFEECRRRVIMGEWGRWFTGCERPLEREVGSRGVGRYVVTGLVV